MATGTTRRKRKLGKFMRYLREQRDLGVEEAVELAETARTNIVRMETGAGLPRRHHFLVILSVYKPSDEDRTRALRLWDYANDDSATVEHGEAMSKSYLAFRQDERDAAAERNYQPFVVPGIAQVERYVNALQGSASDNAQHAAERRARRDQLYAPRSLAFHMLLHEAALHLRVGDSAVMVEQLTHLTELLMLPNVDLQVVPFRVGPFELMHTSAVILDFVDDGEASRSVYLESPSGSRTVENEGQVQALADQFDSACDLALTVDQSAELIQRRIGVYRRDL